MEWCEGAAAFGQTLCLWTLRCQTRHCRAIDDDLSWNFMPLIQRALLDPDAAKEFLCAQQFFDCHILIIWEKIARKRVVLSLKVIWLRSAMVKIPNSQFPAQASIQLSVHGQSLDDDRKLVTRLSYTDVSCSFRRRGRYTVRSISSGTRAREGASRNAF
jgi:hypothetical protein